MPIQQGRKRRADPNSPPSSSPEPATQRRRTLNDDNIDDSFGGDEGLGASDSNLDQMVKKLVRLALACEYNRRPIRRADISEKVLGGTGARKFKQVFEQTQIQLRSVFGMEMIELPSREKVTVRERRAAQKTAEKSKTITAWVLTSTLPAHYRTSDILQPSAVPTSEEEAKYTSIYTLLVALVALSGGTLPDQKMERYLRRLLLEDNTPVQSHPKTEFLMKRMERDGYILRIREPTGTGDDEVYWIVGPRGKVEVGDEGAAGLARAVYGELDEQEEEELERRIGKSLGVAENGAVKQIVVQQNGERKKRGRKKKQPEEEQEEEEGDSGDTEDDDE